MNYRTAFILLTSTVLLCAAPLLVTSADEAAPEQSWQPPEMPKPAAYSEVNLDAKTIQQLEEEWGVRLLGIKIASAGFMLDFRFHVVDVDKALPLFDHRIRPYLVSDRSGIKLPVPMAAKVGALRPTNRGKNIKPDKNYFMIFGNPDRHVKEGETVTIVIGDFVVEHLTVT